MLGKGWKGVKEKEFRDQLDAKGCTFGRNCVRGLTWTR